MVAARRPFVVAPKPSGASAAARTPSLRAQLMVSGIGLLLVPLVLIGTVTFVNSSRTLEAIAEQQTLQLARTFADMIRLSLERDLRVLGTLAADPVVQAEIGSGRFDSAGEKLTKALERLGADYEGLALFDTEGTVRVDGADPSRVGISIASRPYFERARRGEAGVGELVASRATGGPVFVLFAPIRSAGGRPVGGVLAAVKADYLMRFISSFRLGETGYAVMVDRRQVVVAHPNEDRILHRDMSELPELAPLAERMEQGETGSAQYTFEGSRKVIGFTPVPLEGGAVGVVQNREEVLALAYANRNFALAASGFFAVIAFLAMLYLSRAISAPVQRTLTTLNLAVSQAQEALFIVGLDQNVTFANPAMAAVAGRPASELLGRPLSIGGVAPEDFEPMAVALREHRSWSGRLSGAQAGGAGFAWDLSVTPVLDEGGRTTCLLGVGRDVTRERQVEARLRQSEKMEAIGTLAGGVAHDFNNILGAIFGYTELALSAPDDPAATRESLTSILAAAKRARDLVRQILTFSRSAEPGRKPVVLKAVVAEALGLLRPSLPATIEIRTALTSPAAVLGDPIRLQQVLVNLCTNAAYAMREKGGVLEIGVEDVPDEAGVAHAKGRYVRLRISDTGSGIDPRLRPRIFDPFFTTKPPGEGTGLGLSVVHGIVKGLGGLITVESKVGRGSTFEVLLPALAEGGARGADVPAEPSTSGQERILLVDDEPALLAATRQLLEGAGYRVEAFERSGEALERFLADPSAFDAVVTDYTMPQLTGHDLALKLRAVRPELPVLLCSGNQPERETRPGIEGALYLDKPVTKADLTRALRQALGEAGGAKAPGAGPGS